MGPGNVTNGTPIHSPPLPHRMQIQRRGRRGSRNGTNLIHQCGNRQNKGVERERGESGAQRDWRKSEGRGKKEMRSQSKYNKCATTRKDLPFRKLVISSMNQNIKRIQWQILAQPGKNLIGIYVWSFQGCLACGSEGEPHRHCLQCVLRERGNGAYSAQPLTRGNHKSVIGKARREEG